MPRKGPAPQKKPLDLERLGRLPRKTPLPQKRPLEQPVPRKRPLPHDEKKKKKTRLEQPKWPTRLGLALKLFVESVQQ